MKCNDKITEAIVNKFNATIQTLSYCSKAELTTPPEGCTIITVSDKCEVHLLLKGLIDPEKELLKMQKKMEFLTNTKTKLDQAMSVQEYMTKVPEDVKKTNTEKLSQTISELERLGIAMESLKLMK